MTLWPAYGSGHQPDRRRGSSVWVSGAKAQVTFVAKMGRATERCKVAVAAALRKSKKAGGTAGLFVDR